MRISLLMAAAAALSIGATRTAHACGQLPPSYWTLISSSVDAGALIPTDGAILFHGRAWTDGTPSDSSDLLAQGLAVVVRDAAGAAIPGTVEPWFFSRPPAAAWRPIAPLPPDALFTLEAEVTSQVSRPTTATGATSLRAPFRTQASAAAPLQLTGNLQVALETYDQALWKDCNTCGTGCAPNGKIRALRARVTIPPPSGGFAPDGYRAWVWLTNDRPKILPDGPGGTLVNLGGLEVLADGRATEVLMTVPSEDQLYGPCVTVRVFDPAGHIVDPPPLCLPRMDIQGTIGTLDAMGSGKLGTDQTIGCAVALAPSPGPGGVTGWVTLALGFLSTIFARRRAA